MVYVASEGRYGGMKYNRVGKSGLFLPAISLGLWHNFGGVDSFENGRNILRKAFDLGITHFDLANNYGPPPGSAEEMLGKMMKVDFAPYRDELVISTKAGYQMWEGPYGDWGSRKYLISSLDQSLKRMGLEYVDVFTHTARILIHHLKKRWVLLIRSYDKEKRYMWEFQIIVRLKHKKPFGY